MNLGSWSRRGVRAGVVALALFGVAAGSSVLSACGDDAENNTAQKRVKLTLRAEAPPLARAPFTNAYGWTITLSKAELALGAVYFFDGEPIFSRYSRPRPEPLPQRVAHLFVGEAHAHPGHYIAGNALGEMLTSSSLNLLGEGVVLGTGDGVSATYRSGRVTFPETVAGTEAAALDGNIAVLEGVATKEGKNVGFRLSAARADLFDADSEARVEGVSVSPEAEVTGDSTIVLTIDTRKFLDQAEFDGLPEGTTPVDLPRDSDAAENFLRGVRSGPAYVFSLAAP
jgi:hypothetical protein